MTEICRLVGFDGGGRPYGVLDLMDGPTYTRTRDTFKVAPAQPRPSMSRVGGRYGGQRAAGPDQRENGSVTATWRVQGDTHDEALRALEDLLAEVEQARGRDRRIEWRPDGASRSAYLEVRGPGSYEPTYSRLQFGQIASVDAAVTWPVAPLVEWDRMDVLDSFDVVPDGTTTFYDYDASSPILIVGDGSLRASTPSAVHLIEHVGRGYSYGDGEATAEYLAPDVAAASQGADFYAGPYVKGIGETRALHAAVSRKLDGSTALDLLRRNADGSNTNLGGTLTGAVGAIANSARFWVVTRIEGNRLFGEYWTSAPSPAGTPLASRVVDLAGADVTDFGNGATGGVGPAAYWRPTRAPATIESFTFRPYTRKGVTLPAVIPLDGVPGTAPARLDLEVTPAGGSTFPVFALVSWMRRPRAAGASTQGFTTRAPLGILSPVDALVSGGWTLQADAGALFGQRLKDASPTSAEDYLAYWEVDPSAVDPLSEFDEELLVEVWGRVRLHQSLVTPRLAVALKDIDGIGTTRRAIDFPPDGRGFTLPTAAAFRFCKLGMLSVPCGDAFWRLEIRGRLGVGSAGNDWGLDYLLLIPQGARANSPVGVPIDLANLTYPRFVISTSEITRYLSSELRGRSKRETWQAAPVAAPGLGGTSTMQLDPGDCDLLVKLSSMVPDDPDASAVTESLSHVASVHASVTPRGFLTRG